MRFLHTSDWHLGRTLHNVDLNDAQRSVLQQIVRLVAEPPDGVPVDAVLVSGDVYDRAVPNVEAVALFAETLAELARHTTVIVTSGNHDSAIRLGFGSALFTDRLHIRTATGEAGRPVLLGDTAVYPLPYLDPDSARVVLSDGEQPIARSHEAVLGAALARVRADLATRPAGTRSVVMAHAFVVGGQASESERSIVVGGVDHVPAGLFEGFDYVALGHLHGAQKVTAPDGTTIRYSGSPLRYSFSELHQAKSVVLVDVGAAGTTTRLVPLDQPRPMAELTGPLEQLLHDAAHREHETSWVRVTVTDRARPEQLFERVRSRFPHVLQIQHRPEGASEPGHAATITGPVDPRELADSFVQHVTGLPADPAELQLFQAAYEAAALELGRSA